MASASSDAQLPEGVDLHARPAAEVVRQAGAYTAAITLVAGDKRADARSILAVMALGARGGTRLRIEAEGDDAEAAAAGLAGAIEELR